MRHNTASSFALPLLVRGPAPVSHSPGPAPGACFAGPRSPRSPPPDQVRGRLFAPPAPPRIAPHCSPASSLLWQGLTSRLRASSASAHRLPDADRQQAAPVASRGISRFPGKERPHMPGSLTAPRGRALAITRPSVLPSAPRTASAPRNDRLSRLNGWPMRSPADASPLPLRTTTHGSRPMWFAIPSS